MSRALRIQYAGAYYHVTCRGNERHSIFRDDADRSTFLELLERSAGIHAVRLLCYVLMDNHFHLLVQTLDPNLSEFMRHFNITYTGTFNRRYSRSGHLYQGRYNAVVVERDSYLLELSRYLHLNPVRIMGVADKSVEEKAAALSEYVWSSYRGYVLLKARHPFVDYSEVLSFFGGDDAKGRQRYKTFVADGIRSDLTNPSKDTVAQLVLGGEEFVEQMKVRFLKKEKDTRERPSLRMITRDTAAEKVLETVAQATGLRVDELLVKRANTIERGMAMEALYRCCKLTQAQIGEVLGGIDYSTVSASRKEFLLRLNEDKQLQLTFAQIIACLSE